MKRSMAAPRTLEQMKLAPFKACRAKKGKPDLELVQPDCVFGDIVEMNVLVPRQQHVSTYAKIDVDCQSGTCYYVYYEKRT